MVPLRLICACAIGAMWRIWFCGRFQSGRLVARSYRYAFQTMTMFVSSVSAPEIAVICSRARPRRGEIGPAWMARCSVCMDSICLEHFDLNLNHLTLPEIKDFNALGDEQCFKFKSKRYKQPLDFLPESGPSKIVTQEH